MERNVNPGVFLISDIPGSGKSTIARLLANRFERSAHIESDVLQDFTRSGCVSPNGQPPDEARVQLELRTRNLCSLPNNYFGAGFVPIIDDLVATRTHLNQFRDFLHTHPFHFTALCPSPTPVLTRLEERGTWQPSPEE